MATKTVDVSGADYTSVGAWEAALPATLTAIETAMGGNFDSLENVAISGVNTSAAFYLRIATTLANRHDGRSRTVSGTGFRIKDTGGSGTFRVGVNHLRVDGIEIEQTSAAGNPSAVLLNSFAAGSDIRFENCIVHNSVTGSAAYTVVATAANLNLTWRNNYTYGSCRSWDTRGAASVLCENSTFWRFAAELGLVSSAELTCKNTYSGHAGAAAADFLASGGNPSGNNNISSDTTATTLFTSSINSVAGASVFGSVTSAATIDLRLAAGVNALVDSGATLANVTTDAIGTARPQGTGTDVGANERIVSGGGTTETITATVGALALGGLSATVATHTAISAAVGALALGGLSATVAAHQIIAAGIGNVSATGLPATVAEHAAINAAVGAAQYAGLAADVIARTIITAGVGDAQFVGLGASLGGSTVIAAGVGTLAYSGLAATVAEHQIVNAQPGAAQYAGLPAAVVSRTVIAANLGDVQLSGLTAIIGGATVINAQPGAAQYGGLPAVVTNRQSIAAGVGGLAYTGLPATITARTVIAAGVGAATYAGLLATVQSADRDLTAAEAFTYNGEPRVRWYDGEPRQRTL